MLNGTLNEVILAKKLFKAYLTRGALLLNR